MSFNLPAGGAEGSVSESVHFQPPTSSFHEHQGYHMDGRMAMAPPVSSVVSRAPSREPFLHDDGRRGPHYGMHGGGFDHPEYDYGMRRHSCGDHLGLHSGNLLEQLLLQENQKALRIASLVQSQASGCLSGCLSCGLGEKRLRLRESDERMIEEQRCYSRNVGEGPSRSVNFGEADAVECPDGWFRQPRPQQSTGGVGERRVSYSEEELGYQERRVSYPVAHPTISHSQASHHIQDQPLHPVSAAESSVPTYGFSDAAGRVRQRWPIQRQSISGNGTEEDVWHRPSVSRLGPASAREQDRLTLSSLATGSLPRNLVGSPHSPAGDSVRPAQSARTSSQSLLQENPAGDSVRPAQSARTSSQSLLQENPAGDSVRPAQSARTSSQSLLQENSAEPSHQNNVLQQGGTQRVVTQGPISLTDWYIIKVQIAEAGRILETKVALGGWLVHNREHVKTSPVVNRLDIRKVVTEDGVEVILEGIIDKETSNANGFPPGIVQCLSAGFPYMWKQLLRVRSAKESSDLAGSGSLGGIHPKSSKCLSEEESQGINGAKTSKVVLEGMPCSSRDCEGDSPALAVTEEPSVIQTSPKTGSAADERGRSSNVVGSTVSAMARTSAAFETGAVTTPSTLNPLAPRGAVCETGYRVEVATRAETSDAIEAEGAVIARADKSNAVETRCSAQDVLMHQARDASLNRLNSFPATVAPAPATEASGSANEAPASANETPDPAIVAPARVNEAPVEYLAIDSLSNEAGTRPIIDTTAVTIRSSRKNKKALSQPVRSSRRLQQRQYCSPRFSLSMVDSLRPVQTVQVTSGTDLTTDHSGEEEPAQIAPDVKQDQTGREDLTESNDIIEEVLQDLRRADTAALDQCGFYGADSVDIATDIQPMEVEESGQIQDHCKNLPKERDGFEGSKLNEKETTQDESEGVEAQETALVAPSLETERIGETAPVAPPSLVNEEIEESAPITPPELLQSKVQSRIGSLSNLSSGSAPQGSDEYEYPEFSGRMTRSLKRRLKLTPIAETAADVASGSRSSKRLRRLSGSAVKQIPNLDIAHQENTPNVEVIPNPVVTCQEEGRIVEPDSNPITPHQEESDAFYARAREKIKSSNVKAVNCSNCKQPCSPRGLLEYNNVVSSEVTPEEATQVVLKVERVDYPTLPSRHTAGTSGTADQLNRDQTGTCTVKRRSGRFNKMKPANRFVMSGTSRKFLGEDNGKRSSAGEQLGEDPGKGSSSRRQLGEDSGKGSKERRSLGEKSRKGYSARSQLREDVGHGSKQRRSLEENSRKGSSKRTSLGENSDKGSEESKLLGEDSGEGSSEGLRASSSRGKSRRNSLLPPPLPPPRVQDKSKVPEAFGLKTSRSGRLLVPPLAFWRNQSIEYDKDGGIIAIFDGFQAKPADTGCYNFTPPQEKNAKRIQERLCKAAATVTKRK